MKIQLCLGCVLLLCLWVCRWGLLLGGIRHFILLASCAMNFTGTLRPQPAQVRHPVVVHKYNIWNSVRERIYRLS